MWGILGWDDFCGREIAEWVGIFRGLGNFREDGRKGICFVRVDDGLGEFLFFSSYGHRPPSSAEEGTELGVSVFEISLLWCRGFLCRRSVIGATNGMGVGSWVWGLLCIGKFFSPSLIRALAEGSVGIRRVIGG